MSKPQGLARLALYQQLIDSLGSCDIPSIHVKASPCPTVAIGGINQANAEQVLQSGVSSIALIGAICSSDNLGATVSFFTNLFHSYVDRNKDQEGRGLKELGGLMLTDEQFNRYQRQVALPEIGEQGQVKLSQSHVLMIGCGGLGSAASLYLAGSGVGKLVIVDDDDVDFSNLHRQVVYRDKDISSSKTEAMTSQLLALNPAVKIRSLDKRLSKSQLELEVMLADIVLDCSDNMLLGND